MNLGGINMSKTFKNALKTFTSDITGETEKYKVNNAVFLFLETEFGLTYGEFDKQLETNEGSTMAKFVTAVMLANGFDVTYEEVMENTTMSQIIEFYMGFFKISFGQDDDLEDLAKQAEKKREKQKKHKKLKK